MTQLDLASRRWKLQGWRPFYWELRKANETGRIFIPEYGPYPAIVPGSVHTTLRKEGVLPDWNEGLNSLLCEWVEHRHWEYFTEIKAGEIKKGSPVVLEADGLDYSGWILVDGKTVATFCGALVRHRFDLSEALGDGKVHQLAVVFDAPPEEQGQVGFTSKSRYFKPRYNFSWDWCVRVVPTGIWDRLVLVCGAKPFRVNQVYSQISADLKKGKIIAKISDVQEGITPIEITLRDKSGKIAKQERHQIGKGNPELRFDISNPKLWFPNGVGEAYLYQFEIRDLKSKTVVFESPVGFKHVEWKQCQNAPAGARDLICVVNGKSVFIQGINWTPVLLDYPAITSAEYRKLIKLYQDMGCNLLRVWGGGHLEREEFYRLCDEAGLMVWQEFPLSSSGIDNEAPTNPEVIQQLRVIAKDYIQRRSHHASLLLWCGGNELIKPYPDPTSESRPLDETHPALAALLEVVKAEHPGIRFLPASPSGPTFMASRKKMGEGVHHHVHGPWVHDEPKDKWLDYWKHDDALFRSETGVAGASSVELIKRYAGDENAYPPSVENPLWHHSSTWWLQWDFLKKKVGTGTEQAKLKKFVALSQGLQAEYLAIAAQSCKSRFPKCGGFIIWMGHDSFPCPSNTSIIDFDKKPKPAYYALQKVFKSKIA